MSEAASEGLDRQVRLAAFEFLAEQTRLYGETLPWTRLLQGFEFQGRRVPLVSQPGIFRPAILPEVPLTIRTAPEEEGRTRPYADEMDSEGGCGIATGAPIPAIRTTWASAAPCSVGSR